MFSSRSVVIVSLAALALTACGKKGDPLPPLRAIPAPVQDLAVRQQGEVLYLEMAYPNITLSGEALPGVAKVEVLELARPAPAAGFKVEVQPREFAAAAQPSSEFAGERLAAAIQGDRLSLSLPLSDLSAEPTEARVFGTRVTATNGEASGLSNLVALVPRQPPKPPGDLSLIPGADGIEVRWQAATTDEATGGPVGFHLYRRDARSRTYGPPLQGVAPEADRFTDRSAHFGQRYIYTVTTVAQKEPLIESGVGGEAEVFYQDRFPPAAPAGLVALTEASRVRLRWDANPEADIAGYHLYRKGQNDFVRLTRAPVEEQEYVDERVRTGSTYVYRVTAVDAQGNESDAGIEVTTTLR